MANRFFFEKSCHLINSETRNDLICPFKNGDKCRPKRHFYSVILTSLMPQDEQEGLSISQMAQARSQVKTKPQFSVCLEATGIAGRVLNKRAFVCALVMGPFEALASWWAAFHICPSQGGGDWDTEGVGPRTVGNPQLAPSPLGKCASSLPTQIAFQKWKGSVQLQLE